MCKNIKESIFYNIITNPYYKDSATTERVFHVQRGEVSMHGEISQPNKHVACFLSSMASWEQTVDAKLKEEVMRLWKRKKEQEEVAKRQVNMTTLY